jgi:hypothetical protein
VQVMVYRSYCSVIVRWVSLETDGCKKGGIHNTVLVTLHCKCTQIKKRGDVSGWYIIVYWAHCSVKLWISICSYLLVVFPLFESWISFCLLLYDHCFFHLLRLFWTLVEGQTAETKYLICSFWMH